MSSGIFLAWAYFSLQPLFFRERRRCYQRNESLLEKNYFANNLEQTWDKKIYNADEFGLFYQIFSSWKPLIYRKKSLRGASLASFVLRGLLLQAQMKRSFACFPLPNRKNQTASKEYRCFPTDIEDKRKAEWTWKFFSNW